MTCALLKSSEPQDVPLPDDLRDWIDQHTLWRLVLEAIQAANFPDAPASGNAFLRPHIQVSLLTYCYATGVYCSVDIELNSTHDPILGHLLFNSRPEAHLLRRFRRRHREGIRGCLSEVLRRAYHVQLALEAGQSDELMIPNAAEYQVHAPHPDAFAAEAEERINRALRLDCWTLDK